jgi:hypothetical protein
VRRSVVSSERTRKGLPSAACSSVGTRRRK